LVLGGSNGAQRLDKIMHSSLRSLINKQKDIHVLHQVGKGNEDIYQDYTESLKKRIRTTRFISPLAPAIAAADLIVTRAGATTIAEIAALSKSAIVVPHPELTGGHQLQNAASLSVANSALVIDEKQALADRRVMSSALSKLLDSKAVRAELGRNLHEQLPKDATKKISDLLIRVGKGK